MKKFISLVLALVMALSLTTIAWGADAVSTDVELAEKLTANVETISVVLQNDIDLPISSLGSQTPGSGEYKLGGESTKNIVIDLNGNKLNITTTYWSGIGAKNANATITIKNGTMTSSQTTGTWNSYDLTFANCNYVFEGVVFEKAIAFTNAGKTVSITNVTINESHDYYAMWISAKGQTFNIDGLIINSDGRGIKIDEQYVDASSKVTLNVSNAEFNTEKKAAILVESAAGADIAASNCDISNVAADSTNLVWVDTDATDYANNVSVNGTYINADTSAANTVYNNLYLQSTDGSAITVAPADLAYHKAVAPKYNKTTAALEAVGNVAYYTTTAVDFAGVYVAVNTLAEADVVVYKDAAGKNVYMYLDEIETPYYKEGVSFVNFGEDCGQTTYDADKDVKYFTIKGLTFGVYAEVETSTDYLMVGGKMVPVAFVTNHKVAHTPVYEIKNGKVLSIECGVCGLQAVKAPNALSVPKGITAFDGNWYWPTEAAAPVVTDKVQSAETFDAGIAMYVGMSVMAAAGSAVVIGKKKD